MFKLPENILIEMLYSDGHYEDENVRIDSWYLIPDAKKSRQQFLMEELWKNWMLTSQATYPNNLYEPIYNTPRLPPSTSRAKESEGCFFE